MNGCQGNIEALVHTLFIRINSVQFYIVFSLYFTFQAYKNKNMGKLYISIKGPHIDFVGVQFRNNNS